MRLMLSRSSIACVERCGPEDDGDRVGLILLVEEPKLTAELELRVRLRLEGGPVLAAGGLLAAGECRCLCVETGEIAARPVETTAERIQVEEDLLRATLELGALFLQAGHAGAPAPGRWPAARP